jgi:hypothetical protein
MSIEGTQHPTLRGIQEMGAAETQTFHGGRLIARRLKAHGVSKLFTLSGGHLFSIYGRGLGEGDA